MNFFGRLSWGVVIILCLTIGLAPFNPPHAAEKIVLLFQGKLTSPVDWFDLALHGFPWLLLCGKALSSVRPRQQSLPGRHGNNDTEREEPP